MKAFAILLALCAGCSTPVAFGRTGETLPQGSARFAVALPVGIGATEARVTRERGDGSREQHTYRHPFPAGRYDRGLSPLAHRIFAPLLSFELGAAYGLADGFELGVLAGFARIGAELRLGILGRSDDPIAIALSAGVAKQLLMDPRRTELRTGLDFSLRRGVFRPLVNVYLGYTPTALYVVLPDLEGEPRDPERLPDTVVYERDELRLTTPVGAAIWIQPGRGRIAFNASLVAVPEFVLASYNGRDNSASYSARNAIDSIEERWSVFIGIRMELVLKPRAIERTASQVSARSSSP